MWQQSRRDGQSRRRSRRDGETIVLAPGATRSPGSGSSTGPETLEDINDHNNIEEITIGKLLRIWFYMLPHWQLTADSSHSRQPNLERSVKVLLSVLSAIPNNTKEKLEVVVMCIMSTKVVIDGVQHQLTSEFEQIMRGTYELGTASAAALAAPAEILALRLYKKCEEQIPKSRDGVAVQVQLYGGDPANGVALSKQIEAKRRVAVQVRLLTQK